MSNLRKADAVKVLVLIAVAVLLYLWDESNLVVIQAAVIGLLLAAVSQVTRRILMPRLDLQLIAKRAVEDRSMPAAVVFIGMILFLITVMWMALHVLG